MATGLRRHAAGLGAPPLLVVLDCKGGSDARKVADRFSRVLRQAGARSTADLAGRGQPLAVDPAAAAAHDDARRPDRARHGLGRVLRRRDGGADRAGRRGALRAAGQLARPAQQAGAGLAGDGLRGLGNGRRSRADPIGLTAPRRRRAAVPHAVPAARPRARRPGRVRRRRRLVLHPGRHRSDPGRRGPGQGAGRPAGQLRGRAGRGRREILLAVDEFSAVSRRLPIWQLYERARSLGLAVQVSAQSWPGLAGQRGRAVPDRRGRPRAASGCCGPRIPSR